MNVGPWQVTAHPGRGIDAAQRVRDHAGMQSRQPDPPKPPAEPDAYDLLIKLIELRDTLRETHAQLEFLRLMVRLNRPLP
jgi:hypothetical protein